MHAIRDIATDPTTWLAALAFVVGFGLGKSWDAFQYLATGRLPANFRPKGEVELFTVNGAAAYPIGKVIDLESELGHVPEARVRYWKVTRHEELGQVRPLGGEPRWPVRVWGIPL